MTLTTLHWKDWAITTVDDRFILPFSTGDAFEKKSLPNLLFFDGKIIHLSRWKSKSQSHDIKQYTSTSCPLLLLPHTASVEIPDVSRSFLKSTNKNYSSTLRLKLNCFRLPLLWFTPANSYTTVCLYGFDKLGLELVRDFMIERGWGNFILDEAKRKFDVVNFADIAGSYVEKIQRSIK